MISGDKPKMPMGENERDRRRLGPCMACAVAIHAAAFAWHSHPLAHAGEGEGDSLAALGATNVATGTGDARIALMMSRIERSRPPGVSICNTTS